MAEVTTFERGNKPQNMKHKCTYMPLHVSAKCCMQHKCSQLLTAKCDDGVAGWMRRVTVFETAEVFLAAAVAFIAQRMAVAM